MNTPYIEIQNRMSVFSAHILSLIDPLKGAHIPASTIDQLVRSGTSVGANYAEARGAESHADFLHKLQVALKECREAKYWLGVLREKPTLPQRLITELYTECDQFCAILYCSLVTARNG
jgi:four helix bundle protein